MTMDKTRKAIRRASDAELLELRRNWDQYQAQANEAIDMNAKGFGMKKAVKASALEEIAKYRMKTKELIDAEIEARGIGGQL